MFQLEIRNVHEELPSLSFHVVSVFQFITPDVWFTFNIIFPFKYISNNSPMDIYFEYYFFTSRCVHLLNSFRFRSPFGTITSILSHT